MPTPPPDGATADHSGQARDGYVIVYVHPGTNRGQETVTILTFADGVAEGDETAVFRVASGPDGSAALTITDPPPYPTTPTTPPPTGGTYPTNRPPVVSDGAATVDELAGKTATVTGAYSDPDGDPVTVSATVPQGWGSFAAADGTWTWTFPRGDGPRSTSISINAYSTGGSDTATGTATVRNVAPSGLTLTPTSPVIVEGDHTVVRVSDADHPFTATGVFTSDPGDDTWAAKVNYGDGSALQTVAVRPGVVFEMSHVYATAGQYVVSVRVEDDDGGATPEATLDVAALKILSLSGFDLAHPGNDGTNFDKGQPTHWYVGQRDGQAGVDVELLVDYEPIFGPAQGHILWRAIGAGAAPASGSFLATANSADHKLTLTPGVRDYLIRAGFDCDASGDLSDHEVTQELNVHVVKLNTLTAADAANAANKAVSAALPPGGIAHVIVGQPDGGGPALVDLSADIVPGGAAAAGHVLWTSSGATVGPRTRGDFGAGTEALSLTPAAGNRDFVFKAGFDYDASGGLAEAEVDREVHVHVVRAELDADSDNTNGTGEPDYSPHEESIERRPPGKYVLLNDDVEEVEDDLVPVVLDFTGLGSSREDLKYRLGVAEGSSRVKLWADPRKEAPFAAAALQDLPTSARLTVWVEGVALSAAPGDVRLRKELVQLPANAEAVVVAADEVRLTVVTVNLVAHRTGGKFGEAVPRDVEDGADPSKGAN